MTDGMGKLLHEHRTAIADFATRWMIAELSVFGSYARGEEQADSDVDILVSFVPNHPWSVLDHIQMEYELSDILGRQVEIVSRKALDESANPRIREAICSSAVRLYAA